jgi:hypothetical protein
MQYTLLLSVVIASLNRPDSDKKKKKKKQLKMGDGLKKTPKTDVNKDMNRQLIVAEPQMVEGTQTAAEVLRSIARDVNGLSDPNAMTRKKSADKMYNILFGSTIHKDEVLQELFDDLYKPLFKRFDDPTEKVRELCIDMSCRFFEKLEDLMPPLPYLFPAIISRCRFSLLSLSLSPPPFILLNRFRCSCSHLQKPPSVSFLSTILLL